ncbi:kinetochore-associated protein Nsl1p [Trichomonascus vanleenenianus]|uniref:MIND complex subunit NSL1 n=1 Tax=Trichomonascus vanleenenianus TaxID=2268995 RepID=UPI003EC9FF91
MSDSTGETLHTKLQLVAEDVRFLKNQFLEAAEAKLNLHLPTTEEASQDPLRDQVRDLVEMFVHDTFEMARHAMIVDGEDMSEKESLQLMLDTSNEEIEPFDVDLNEKLRRIYAEVDERTLEVSELRRSVPLQVVERYEMANRPIVEDNSAMEDDTDHIAVDIDFKEVEKDYEAALEQLAKLRGSVPDSYAELDKLRETIQYLKERSS